MCVVGLAACDSNSNDDVANDKVSSHVTLKFAAKVGGEDFACGRTYSNLGIAASEEGRSMKVLDYRVFVSEIALTDADGSRTPVQLTRDGVWQYQNVALLDFENSCKESPAHRRSTPRSMALCRQVTTSGFA